MHKCQLEYHADAGMLSGEIRQTRDSLLRWNARIKGYRAGHAHLKSCNAVHATYTANHKPIRKRMIFVVATASSCSNLSAAIHCQGLHSMATQYQALNFDGISGPVDA